MQVNYHLKKEVMGSSLNLVCRGGVLRKEAIFLRIWRVALSICLLERLCFIVFTAPKFEILGDFPLFRLLGFNFGGFSVIPSFRISEIFRHSAVPRFHLLGFGVVFHCSVIPAFRVATAKFADKCMEIRKINRARSSQATSFKLAWWIQFSAQYFNAAIHFKIA